MTSIGFQDFTEKFCASTHFVVSEMNVKFYCDETLVFKVDMFSPSSSILSENTKSLRGFYPSEELNLPYHQFSEDLIVDESDLYLVPDHNPANEIYFLGGVPIFTDFTFPRDYLHSVSKSRFEGFLLSIKNCIFYLYSRTFCHGNFYGIKMWKALGVLGEEYPNISPGLDCDHILNLEAQSSPVEQSCSKIENKRANREVNLSFTPWIVSHAKHPFVRRYFGHAHFAKHCVGIASLKLVWSSNDRLKLSLMTKNGNRGLPKETFEFLGGRRLLHRLVDYFYRLVYDDCLARDIRNSPYNLYGRNIPLPVKRLSERRIPEKPYLTFFEISQRPTWVRPNIDVPKHLLRSLLAQEVANSKLHLIFKKRWLTSSVKRLFFPTLTAQSDDSDFDFYEAEESLNISGSNERKMWYNLAETVSHLIGDYRAIVQHRKLTGRIPWHQVARAVHTFMRSLGMRSFTEFALASLPALYGLNEEGEFVAQGDRDIDLLYFCLSLPFTSKSGKGRFQNAVYNYKRTGGVADQKDLFLKSLDFFWFLINAGTAAFEQRSFKPFFHSGKNWFEWLRKAEDALAKYADFEEGTLLFDDYMTLLNDVIVNGEAIERRLKSDPSSGSFRLVHSKLEKVKELLNRETLLNRVRRERQPPFFLAIYGNPGSGKTSTMKLLIKTILDTIGQPFDMGRVYSHNPAAAHENGLRTFHNVVIADDFNIVSPEKAPEMGLSGAKLVMELANTVPVASNQAAIEDKGVIFAHPKVVAITSNTKDFGASHLQDPAAFVRRLGFRVHFHVKEEYAKEGNNALDTAKLPSDEYLIPHQYSVVAFNCYSKRGELNEVHGYVKDPSNDEHGYHEEVVLNKVEAKVFFPWLAQQARKHFQGGENF
jgi:hypothetical protein